MGSARAECAVSAARCDIFSFAAASDVSHARIFRSTAWQACCSTRTADDRPRKCQLCALPEFRDLAPPKSTNVEGVSMRTRLVIAGLLITSCLAMAAHAVTTATCFTPLFGFGPVDPVNGFPQYYQDSAGLALAPCLDAVCGGVGFALPDPNLPLSFPDNFPVETFYSR